MFGLRWIDEFGFSLPHSGLVLYDFAEPGYVFDKACVVNYNHMSFGGGPLEVGTEEEAEKLMSQNEKDSANGNNFFANVILIETSSASCWMKIGDIALAHDLT